MKSEIRYDLPIYSTTLEKDPVIKTKGMDMWLELIGEDEEKRRRKISIRFNTVLCHKHTSARFTPILYDSYDRVVELLDSDWLQELKSINQDEFNYWGLKHYILYLSDIGMFQFIAQECEIIEYE